MRNKQSVFSTLGARNYAKTDREEHDYYATPAVAVEELLKVEDFYDTILEPACGEGHIAEVLRAKGFSVYSSDLIDRNYGKVKDFFEYQHTSSDIITNPPYKYAKEFVEHSLEITENKAKIAMLLKLQFLESKKRRELFDKFPPKYMYVFSSRISCAKNGKFLANGMGSGNAVAYAWFIWVKGEYDEPRIRWIG